ncbi:hypothetical protein ACW9H6_22265 [Pseudomonas sp. SDO528_S397]
MSEAYIHYSSAYLERFLPTEDRDGYFMTQTQGFLYVTKMGSRMGSATTFARPNSALLFVGEAARHFKPHPLFDPLFFKRLWSQCVSRERFYDWCWKLEDTRRVGSVLVISNIHRVPMDQHSPVDALCTRSAQQRLKRMKNLYHLFSGIAALMLVLAVLVLFYVLHAKLCSSMSWSIGPELLLFGITIPLGAVFKGSLGVLVSAGLAGFVVSALRKNRFIEHTLKHLKP